MLWRPCDIESGEKREIGKVVPGTGAAIRATTAIPLKNDRFFE